MRVRERASQTNVSFVAVADAHRRLCGSVRAELIEERDVVVAKITELQAACEPIHALLGSAEVQKQLAQGPTQLRQ